MAEFYRFGIEIELISAPHKVRSPLVPIQYYDLFARALRKRGLRAEADTLVHGYRKHVEQYEKGWWITRDSSLGSPDHPLSESAADCNRAFLEADIAAKSLLKPSPES